jgi:transposase
MIDHGTKFDLSDEQGDIISITLKDEKLRPGPTIRRSYRDYLNGIFYRARSGCTWKQVPKRYGRGDRCCHWYADWYEKGLLHVILVELSEDLKARAGVDVHQIHQAW